MIRSQPGFGRCPSLGYPKNGPTHATARIRHQTRQSSQAFFFERAASSACLVESIFIACVIRCILASGRFAPAIQSRYSRRCGPVQPPKNSSSPFSSKALTKSFGMSAISSFDFRRRVLPGPAGCYSGIVFNCSPDRGCGRTPSEARMGLMSAAVTAPAWLPHELRM
jgi:hypothetical protein